MGMEASIRLITFRHAHPKRWAWHPAPGESRQIFDGGASTMSNSETARLETVDESPRARELPPRGRTGAVMPAYNAAATLRQTVEDIPVGVVDEVVLVDDCSRDDTVNVARELGLTVVTHER